MFLSLIYMKVSDETGSKSRELLKLIKVNFQEKHGFWFDIQDVTGTTLSAKARFQINMNVPKIANYDDLAAINTTVIPILWMEEGIDELGPEIIGVLKQAVTEPREWRQAEINNSQYFAIIGNNVGG